MAANLYRDPALNLVGVGEKVKTLINAHISARGVDPKIPPTTEQALRAFVADLRKGDSNDFPDLDPKAQVPFVRLLLEQCRSRPR